MTNQPPISTLDPDLLEGIELVELAAKGKVLSELALNDLQKQQEQNDKFAKKLTEQITIAEKRMNNASEHLRYAVLNLIKINKTTPATSYYQPTTKP